MNIEQQIYNQVRGQVCDQVKNLIVNQLYEK